jgi:hypothetical protein
LGRDFRRDLGGGRFLKFFDTLVGGANGLATRSQRKTGAKGEGDSQWAKDNSITAKLGHG